MSEKTKETLGAVGAVLLFFGLPIGLAITNNTPPSEGSVDDTAAQYEGPECRTEEIPFESEEEESYDLYVGDSETGTEGVAGEREICELDGDEVSNEVITEPTTEIVLVGALEEEEESYGYNDVGCPKNQYVSGYYRSNGTYVNSYYRNSPSDDCY